jgi:hypothetical protein
VNTRLPSDLVGATVTGIARIHDYVQLEFDVAVLNLFNPLIEPVPSEQQAKGLRVVSIVIIDDHYLSVQLEEHEVKMSLQPEDFHGPEAAEICFRTGEIIVI